MAPILAALRDGAFLTPERLRVYPGALVAGFVIFITYLFCTAHGLLDYDGRPLGTDFSNVYAAGMAALSGHPAAPFDILLQQRQEQALFGAATPLYGWHYPPFFLLVATLLALLPYLPALIVWQLGTLGLYLWSLVALTRASTWPHWARIRILLLPALGFTAVYVNLTHGNNGFLTAALFAGGLGLLDKRPLLAGLLLGLLAYKPQYAMLIPLVLIATARWRALGAFILTIFALGLLVTGLFGWAVWPAFLAGTEFTRTVVLEQGSTGFQKMQSVFAAIRLLGGPVWGAYSAQTGVAALAVTGLVQIWRRPHASFSDKAASLCLAALLVTPYSLDYDLMVLAPALLLLATQGKCRGFRPFEITLLIFLWGLPFAARTFAGVTHIVVAPLAIAALFALLWRDGTTLEKPALLGTVGFPSERMPAA
jgi:hypothetical protein